MKTVRIKISKSSQDLSPIDFLRSCMEYLNSRPEVRNQEKTVSELFEEFAISKCAIAIEYAYPSSETATKSGYGKSGCWFIGLYPSIESTIGMIKILMISDNKNKVMQYAEKLPNPYTNAHVKYFNT